MRGFTFEILGAGRLVDTFNNPAIRLRGKDSFDLGVMIKRHRLIIAIGWFEGLTLL